MPIYEINDPNTGLVVEVEADRAPTQEEAEAFLKNRQANSIELLAEGPGFSDKRTSRGKRIRIDPNKFYSKEIPKYLGIPEEDFDYNQSAPLGMRFKMDFLRNKSDREAVLRKEFGDNNVVSLNLGGQQKILFKNPKTNKWGFYDSFDADLADFTADLAGDIVPIGAGIAAGAKTLFAAPFTGGASVLATSAAAAGAEAVVGSAQDVAARAAFGLDVEAEDLAEIAQYRATEGGINFTINALTMGTGKVPINMFISKEGADLARQQALSVLENTSAKIPIFVKEGGEKLVHAQDIASKYPNSAVAKMFAESRELAATKIQAQFAGQEITQEQADQILRESFETLSAQYGDDIARITNTLDTLAAEKIALKEGVPTGLDSKARQEAKKVFNAELNNKAKTVLTPVRLSPEQTGLTLQDNVARNYVQTEAASRNAFESVYDNLVDVSTDANRIARIFTKRKNEAITNMEGEIVSVLAPNARTTAGRAATSLKELAEAGEPVTFKQLNEMIQVIEESTKRGSTSPGFNASEYRNMAESLRNLRTKLLQQADPATRKAFNDANKNFQDVVLPFRTSDIFNSVKAEIGDSYSTAIARAQQGQSFRLPRLESGGTAVLDRALLNPKSVQDFLRATGNDPAMRQLLRDYWLSSKNLVGGKPLLKKDLNLTEKDFDIANILFPGQGKNSFSAKVNTLRDLQRFTDGADEYIEGLTAETFDRLMREGVEGTQLQLKEVAKNEVINKQKLNKLTSEKLVKLMNDGALPLPSNQTTMESLVGGILKAKPVEIERFMKTLQANNPDSIPAFKQALYHHLVQKSGSRIKDSTQKNLIGEPLWDPLRMDSQLIANKEAIIKILGKEKYDSIKLMNEGMQRFSVLDKEALGKISGAGNERGFKAFISNVPGAIKDRYGALMLAKEIKDPTHFKKMLTQENYDKTMTALNASLFFGLNSIRAMQDNADADPRFRRDITERYKAIFEQAQELDAQIERELSR